MIVLKILLGILIFFALILLIRATVTIEYGETLSLVVSVFGIIRIRILPSKPKKVRLGKYNPKKIKKRQLFSPACKSAIRFTNTYSAKAS